MNKITYISDVFLEDLIGGGELNDYELCKELARKNNKLIRLRSNQVTLDHIKDDQFYIVSNFINLSAEVKKYMQRNSSYIIYEHDHKYLITRNPAKYKDYKAPKEHVVNVEFYENAKKVFCQSSFHEKIIKNNLNLTNLVNVSGNLWSENDLEAMRRFSKKEKSNCYSILNSNILHKNTREARMYCELKGYKYSLISSKNYQEFLNLLSNNNKFIFLPNTPETLSRVIVEARMMNIKTIANKKVGACYEPWFNLKGEELINVMFNKKNEVVQKIMEIANG